MHHSRIWRLKRNFIGNLRKNYPSLVGTGTVCNLKCLLLKGYITVCFFQPRCEIANPELGLDKYCKGKTGIFFRVFFTFSGEAAAPLIKCRLLHLDIRSTGTKFIGLVPSIVVFYLHFVQQRFKYFEKMSTPM